jgi:hypothetical protein
MTYVRPTNSARLTVDEKAELLTQYGKVYQDLAQTNPAALNRKLPRSALAESLDRIGAVILDEAHALAASNPEVRRFLDENPLPEGMDALLPDDVRAFALLVNGLKQFLSTEQAAIDKYALGAGARSRCRKMLTHCPVTGEALSGSVELHHPVRDGRPPIPVSRNGQRILEQQTAATEEEDAVGAMLREIKKPNDTWPMLRRGCLLLSGEAPEGGTSNGNAAAKSFARRALAKTELTVDDLLGWLDGREGAAGATE